MQKYKTKPPKPDYVEAMQFIVNTKDGWPPGVYKDSQSPSGYRIGPMEVREGEYIVNKGGIRCPMPQEQFEKIYEPVAGESVDIGIRVKEDPPEQSNGIRFMTIVRIDRNMFQAAKPKEARLMVRRQFQFALPPLMKVVDEEHVKLNPTDDGGRIPGNCGK